MADIKVVPCIDDNQHRELILGKAPSFTVTYDAVGDVAKKGESLYFVKYKFKEGCRDQGFEAFANMTEEMDKVDTGKCTSYGRWHVPSQGCGYAIASCPTGFDMYRWAFNWNALCDCYISPVTNDQDTREIIQQSMGFKVKHAQIMEHMKQFMDSGPCYVNAKFTFKDTEKKQKFIDILKGEDGLVVTRAWSGCQSIECYESQENNLEFSIKQKWDKESDHTSYMAMRKETGLFASVMEMLSTPLEVTHLKCLDC